MELATDLITADKLTDAPNASIWAVTALAHPGVRDVSDNCPQCLALAEDAIVNARVTGSRGATFTREDGENHSVTVARAIAVTAR